MLIKFPVNISSEEIEFNPSTLAIFPILLVFVCMIIELVFPAHPGSIEKLVSLQVFFVIIYIIIYCTEYFSQPLAYILLFSVGIFLFRISRRNR